MNNIFSIPFRKILLRVDQHLTSTDKEHFRFYFNDFLPKSVNSLLEMLEALKDQDFISYEKVEHLKEFAVTIGRKDVAKLLEEYETRVGLKMVIYGYFDFRSGSRNASSPPLLTTDCVSKHLVCSARSQDEGLLVAVKNPHSLSLKPAFGKLFEERFPMTKERYRWEDVLEMIQICAEFVYLRLLFERNFKQMMADVEEVVEGVLGVKVVPWMVENGGMSACYSVIAPHVAGIEGCTKTGGSPTLDKPKRTNKTA